MDLGLVGKVALVTGGSKGIGLGIVRRLIAEGACVANVNRSEAEGRALERQYADEGKECFFIQGDLADVDACRNAVEQTLTRFGRLDILVNNAGVNDGVGLGAGVDAFVDSLRRNLIHVYAMAHFALDALKKSRGP
ncbi:MAG: SDR family NAD(P)-dependent oxidoreductase, partial [Planctomycetaceae bacterium]